MSLVVVVLLIALLIGWAAGGAVGRLGGLPLNAPQLVVAALLVQLVGAVAGGPVHPVGLVVSALLVLAFLARNRRLRGTGLVATGLLLNAVVIGANGAMPVSADAAARAGLALEDLVADARHEPADEATRVRLLGDVVPVLLPRRPEVVSPGDVLLSAGLGQLVVAGMLTRGRQALPERVRLDRGSVQP